MLMLTELYGSYAYEYYIAIFTTLAVVLHLTCF